MPAPSLRRGPKAHHEEVRFLTVAEVASIMRVSKMTVYRMVHSGVLPAIRVGRSYRVPERSVHEYVDETGSRLRVLG
ncbi:helix-turn-helix domain-containing protein [Nocardiopsis dassonvillei]|uniref:helix-turn-helix domain-containing protein n=1 Tax=Nocardiopsis dassonvillei TaxID=2014 RepID=UPI0027E37089|nr:helix-turn-helix domain-containing protein [Nocardiopsis dassonvillei]